MPWYKAGTVSVVQNSNAVVGTGTAFIVNARVGDAFRGPDGGWYEVTNIASDTAMSILPNYQGATASVGAYALAPMQGYVKDSADALRALVNQFGTKLAALGTTGNYDTLPISKGGTGANDANGARAALGLADTGGLAEGVNKYFTDARVRSTPLTGLTTDDGSAVAATDAVLAALGKLQAQATVAANGISSANTAVSGKAAKGANADITSLSGLTTAISIGQGGTGVTTMAGLLTALGNAGVYQINNIIGTVSQSAGVPNGSLFQTITNANGTAIKYADGTMICRQTVDCGSVAITVASGTLYASASQAPRPFAATFASFPACHISLISSAATAYAGSFSLPTVSASQAFYVIAPSAVAQSVTAVITAIGRWF